MLKQKTVCEWRRGLLVCVGTLFLWMVIFALAGVGIGTGVSLTFSDAYNQYLPFHAEFRQLLLNKEWNQFLYNWNLGFGASFVGVYGYYLSSPFVLLSLFFETDRLSTYFYWVILLKVGLSSVTSYLFFVHQPQVKPKVAMVFGVLYACMGTLMDRFYNVMWLDAIWMLPLTIRMLQRLIHQKRWKGFLFCLIYLFWSNFYMAYMVGIFCLIWFLIEIFLYHQGTIKEKWQRFVVFMGCAGLATMVCGALLWPTFLALKETGYSQGISFDETHHLIQSLSDFFIGSYNGLTENAPGNIYISLVGFLATVSFFCHPLIEKKERLVFFGIVAFFFLSFSCPVLDWIWHGFKMPKGFPNRYAFLLSFLMLSLGCRSFSSNSIQQESLRVKWVKRSSQMALVATTGITLSTCFSGLGLEGITDLSMMLINLGWLGGYVLLFILSEKGAFRVKGYFQIGLILLGLELLLNGFMTVYQLKTTQYSLRDENLVHYQQIEEALESLDRKMFDRVLLPEQSLNASLLHRVPTIENYNTLGHRQTNGFLHLLVYGSTLEIPKVEPKNEFFKTTPSLLMDSLLGLKYYYRPLLKTESMGDLGWLEVVSEEWFKNPYALPLAFPVSSKTFEVDLSDEWKDSPFENQERLLNLLLGNELDSEDYLDFAKSWEVQVVELDNLEFESFSRKYTKVDLNRDSWMTVKVIPPQSDEALPVYFSLDTDTKHEVWLGGEPLMNMGNQYVFDSFPLTEVFDLKIKLEAKDNGRFAPLKIASFDESMVIQAIESLDKKALGEWKINGNVAQVKVELDEPAAYWLSIPYSPNWGATIEGERVELYTIQNAFMGIQLPKGSYTLELTYMVQGLKEGVYMSLLGVLLVSGLSWWSVQTNKKREG